MTQLVNGTAVAETKLDPLLGLAGHLTDPQDRETYAALISYFHSLPPGDELFRLAKLLGFLSLLGQRLPDALTEFLRELRDQTRAADEYHAKLDERLARLPDEITTGVDPDAIAKAMSESFRQQLATTGLQDSAQLLGVSVAGLRKLSGDLSESMRPLTSQYAGIGMTVTRELTKLINASAELRQHNANLVGRAADERWQWKVFFCLFLLCIGFFCGLALEKRSTTDAIVDLEA